MAAWIVVGGSAALLVLMVLVLVRQGSPASLSDEDGKTPQRERFVVGGVQTSQPSRGLSVSPG